MKNASPVRPREDAQTQQQAVAGADQDITQPQTYLRDGRSAYELYSKSIEESGNAAQQWDNIPGPQQVAWNELMTLTGRKLYSIWQHELENTGNSGINWNRLLDYQQQAWQSLAEALQGSAPSVSNAARTTAGGQDHTTQPATVDAI